METQYHGTGTEVHEDGFVVIGMIMEISESRWSLRSERKPLNTNKFVELFIEK